MRARSIPRTLLALAPLLLAVALWQCGKSDTNDDPGGSEGPPPDPPDELVDLQYAHNPAIYTVDIPIPPNVATSASALDTPKGEKVTASSSRSWS